ncbi:uncharacterized protein BO87DRAFT_157480 [Aspergillus neoniger CBS 115656]|uniref:Uncharacterized protein n=1 Tax=Aspergillus neoniger (strain CBS 115656) TaxID=1448310 RepID=A0A318Y8M5_ASPNB|nr:hypothetical protein BO87DRAFT_157480 [Aspergillus neoniger CBS 115656]PYH30299.1 hypothetical protein BO87DRAFT_157480 [Aspergillus neoniger CBS 115656]
MRWIKISTSGIDLIALSLSYHLLRFPVFVLLWLFPFRFPFFPASYFFGSESFYFIFMVCCMKFAF